MKNKGISLIVLIITIVVIIILATAVIINLTNSNIIGNANDAVFRNNVVNLKAELEVYVSNKLSDTLGEYDRTRLNADESFGKYGEEEIKDENKDGKSDIYDVLGSLKKSNLKGKVSVEEGELAFSKDGLTDEQIKILENSGVKISGKITITDIETEEIVDGIRVTVIMDDTKDVVKYKYILDGELEEESTEATKEYTDLDKTSYTLEVIAILKDGTQVSKSKVIKVNIVKDRIFYKLSTNKWTNGDITVILSYGEEIPEGYVIQYRIGEEEDWKEGTSLKVTENTIVRGRLYNSTTDDEKSASSKNITNIDKEAPTKPKLIALDEDNKNIKVKAEGSTDSISGVIGYQYKLGSNEWSDTTTLEYEFKDLTGGEEYTIYARAVDATKNNYSSEFSDTVFIRKNTLYVSTSGNDDTGDGTIDAPYATISKAINIAETGDKIQVLAGEYTLSSVAASSYTSYGIYDMDKNIEIVGENEKTILTYRGSSASTRDACGICLLNEKSILRNLTYVFYPKSSNNSHSKAIFGFSKGSIDNVFFRIDGENVASYFYGNMAGDTAKITNCSFYHNSGSVLGNYQGSPMFTNIATNVATNGTNKNIITSNFGYLKLSVSQLIQTSKDYEEFNTNKVGVFHGKYAWKNYTDIDFKFNLDDYIINVSPSGNDDTGNGTTKAPYATVSKAISVASSGDKIHILEGEYTLKPMDNGAGINDNGKKLEIYGDNEKTILTYNGGTATTRDAPAFILSNSGTTIRNITYIFKPKTSGNMYSRSIFLGGTTASIKNIFMRISGSNKASYLYGTAGYKITNCTFYHDLGSVDGNYSGSATFTNIATNVNTNGTNKNVVTNSFATADVSLVDLIKASKDNESFNTSSVGVFYGEYAWK